MQALRVLELVLLDHTQRVGRVKVDALPLCHRSLFRRPHWGTTDQSSLSSGFVDSVRGLHPP